MRVAVFGFCELGLVGDLDAALDRQRAPVARRPGAPVVEAPGPPVRGACDAEGLPDDHRAVRRGALAERSQRPRPVADRALLLGLQPDEEARAVDEMDERQVECAREVDETRDLL